MARYVSSAILALVVGSVLHSANVAAQSAPPAPEAAPEVMAEGAEEATGGFEEVVVTARRKSESLERTPVAVSVLSGEALARQAISSEADLQLAVPGLVVKAGQSDNQLNYSLRGQTVDAFSSSRPSVLPYFNEVQVGGSGANAFYDLESIQVLKGPQGTLFGRNSTGGAVLFTTAKPKDEFGGYAVLRAGNYSEVGAEGAINVPVIEDKLLMRLAVNYQTRDGYQENLFNGETLGDVYRKNARLSLTFKPTDTMSNNLVLDYAESGGNNLTSVAYNILTVDQNVPGNPFVPNNFLYSPAVDAAFGPGAWDGFLALHPGADPDGIVAFVDKQQKRGPFKVDVNAPNFHKAENFILSNVTVWELSEKTQIKNIIGYTDLQTSDASEFDGTPFPADDNGTEGRGGTLKQFSEEFQFLGNAFDDQLSYVTGLYFSDEKDHTRSLSVLFDLLPTAPPTNQINDGERKNETYAIYGQGTLDLSTMTGVEGLGVTAGARYSSEKVTFTHLPEDTYIVNPPPPGAVFVNPLEDTFEKVSWTLGVQEQLNPDLLLYAVSRRSFRSGGFNFFAPPLEGFGNEGGSEYDAETATDFEIGAKYVGAIGDAPVRFNIAAYQMWIEDIQRSNYVSIFGALAGITVNVPEAEVMGVEIDGEIRPADWLSLGGNVNYTDAEFTENSVSVLGNPAVAFGPYPDAPEWSAAAYADATFPMGDALNFSIRADAYYQSESFFSSTNNTLNPGTEIDGYTIGNLRFGVESSDGAWSVMGHVHNISDETYYVGGIGFSSLFAINTVIPGAPRTYMVEARFNF